MRRLSRLSFLTLVALVGLLMSTITPAAASVSITSSVSAEVRGTVWSLAVSSNRVFAGGEFTQVGTRARTNLVSLYHNGYPDLGFDIPVNGVVKALAVSPDQSKLFVGGQFTEVGGVPRANLAAIDLATKTVIAGWQADANDGVLALKTFGDRLYVAGKFTAIGTKNIKRLAAVNVNTGVVQTSFNPWPTYNVSAIDLTPDGTKLYAAGSFTQMRGLERKGLAEVDTATGLPTAWKPTVTGMFITIDVSPSGQQVYTSLPDNRFFMFQPAVGNDPVYTLKGGGDTQAILDMGTEMYFGGHFGQIQDQAKRQHIASADPNTGLLTPWDPGVGGSLGVWALAATPTALVVGGDFYKAGGRWQQGIAFFAGTP